MLIPDNGALSVEVIVNRLYMHTYHAFEEKNRMIHFMNAYFVFVVIVGRGLDV